MSDDLVKRLREGDEFERAMSAERAADRIEELEAKLAKAVAALDKIKRIDNLVGVFAACERTLAKLTNGGKND